MLNESNVLHAAPGFQIFLQILGWSFSLKSCPLMCQSHQLLINQTFSERFNNYASRLFHWLDNWRNRPAPHTLLDVILQISVDFLWLWLWLWLMVLARVFSFVVSQSGLPSSFFRLKFFSKTGAGKATTIMPLKEQMTPVMRPNMLNGVISPYL